MHIGCVVVWHYFIVTFWILQMHSVPAMWQQEPRYGVPPPSINDNLHSADRFLGKEGSHIAADEIIVGVQAPLPIQLIKHASDPLTQRSSTVWTEHRSGNDKHWLGPVLAWQVDRWIARWRHRARDTPWGHGQVDDVTRSTWQSFLAISRGISFSRRDYVCEDECMARCGLCDGSDFPRTAWSKFNAEWMLIRSGSLSSVQSKCTRLPPRVCTLIGL